MKEGKARNLKAGMDAENMDGCLLAYWFALHVLFTLFSYKTQDHLPSNDTIHSEWGPPLTLPGEENTLTALPTSQSDRGIFSIEVPSSPVTLACFKVTKN